MQLKKKEDDLLTAKATVDRFANAVSIFKNKKKKILSINN